MTGDRFWGTTTAVATRQVSKFAKTGHFVPPVLIPALFFGAFAGGLSAIAKNPDFTYSGGYTTFIFVFVLLQGSSFSAIFSAITLAEDLEIGFTGRMLLATPRRMSIVLGISLAALVEALFVAVVLFGIGLAAQMNLDANLLQIAGVIALALLLNVAISLYGAGVALRLKTVQSAPIMMLPLFVFLFVAPVYVPRELLSGWLHVGANVNPLTPVFEACRALLVGQNDHVVAAFVSVFALMAVFYVYALTGMRKAEGK